MDRAPAIHTYESHHKCDTMSARPIPFTFLLSSINCNRNRISTILLHPPIVSPTPNSKSKEGLISGFFTRDTQHDAKESCSHRKKSRAALAEKLDETDQLSEANKSLRAPDMRVHSKQRRKELSSRSNKNGKSNESPGLLVSATASAAHAKSKRTNHAAGDNMGEAVKEWDILKASVGGPSKKYFALSKCIHPYTFQYYAHNDVSKRRKISGGVGKHSVAVVLAAASDTTGATHSKPEANSTCNAVDEKMGDAVK